MPFKKHHEKMKKILTSEAVEVIEELSSIGFSTRTLAAMYGVSQAHIRKIKAGYKHTDRSNQE
jgi:predicted transcriptional regulator